MSQTDNKEMLIRILNVYYKSLNNIENSKNFKKLINKDLISFVDAYAKIFWKNMSDGFISKNVQIKKGKTNFKFQYGCFLFWFLLLLVTMCWIDSIISGLVNDYLHYDLERFVPYKIRHSHSLQLLPRIIIFFVLFTIFLKILSAILKKIGSVKKHVLISFEVYKNNINYMIYKLKETPWQEVDKMLKQMKEEGVEFPKGVNFKV